MRAMKKGQKKPEIGYIFGKHAVREVLQERPDVVVEIHAAPEFSDERILGAAEFNKVPVQLLNLKNPPRGISSNAAHQGIVAGILPEKLTVPYKEFISSLKVTDHTGLLVLGEVQDPHNVGAVIRSAAAFGIKGVLIPPHNQAPITGTLVKVHVGMASPIPPLTLPNVNPPNRHLHEPRY